MPYEIDYLEDEKFIIIKHTGEGTFADYVEQTQKVVELSKGESVKILSDARLLINKATTSEIYELPKIYDEKGTSKGNKLALLIEKQSPIVVDALFYETVCQTRGHNVRVFIDYDEAMGWLKE